MSDTEIWKLEGYSEAQTIVAQALIVTSSVRFRFLSKKRLHESPTPNDLGFKKPYRCKEVSVQDVLELVARLDLNMPESWAFEV